MSIHGGASSWVRRGRYAWDGPGGVRVSAARGGSGDAAGWRYSAWGAEDQPELKYWQWHDAACNQESYERGQETPARRRWLGVYAEAAEARQAALGGETGQGGRD